MLQNRRIPADKIIRSVPHAAAQPLTGGAEGPPTFWHQGNAGAPRRSWSSRGSREGACLSSRSSPRGGHNGLGLVIRHRKVLNAFRHHGGGHGGETSGNPVCSSGCSTPFGITEVGIVHEPHRPGGNQMCSTPFGITEVGMRYPGGDGPDRHECSTPFGITEVGIAGRRSCGGSLLLVLNAFRHHRGGHRSDRNKGGDGTMCSTPFGITEVGMASRSSRDSLPRQCSTPFGITEVGIAWYRPMFANQDGAQRLSASQRWA